MGQTINLNDYKASGVYTVEVIDDQQVTLPITTGRLVIGSSRIGPYNTVVLIDSPRTRRAVYGDNDPKLEKAGSYFHRTIDIALREGPVFALNVIPLDTDEDVLSNLDQATFSTFNTEASSNNNDDPTSEYPTVQFFNRQKLWISDSEQLNRSKNLALGDDFVTNPGSLGQVTLESNKILSFVNLGKSNITIWVRKADIRGYDVTAKEWYSTVAGSDIEFPEYVHEDDFISDYFVEVIVLNGDWSDAKKLSSDPTYRQFFDPSGLKQSRSADFFALRETTVISRTIGCLIPDFKDQSGTTVAIDRLFNRLFPTTGVMCAIDEDKLDLVDFTNDDFTDADVETHRIDIVGHGYDELNSQDVYTADTGGFDPSGTALDPTPLIDTISYRKPADADLCYIVDNNPSVGGLVTEANFKLGWQDAGASVSIAFGEVYLVDATIGDNYLVAMEDSAFYKSYVQGFIQDGDIVNDGTTDYYIKVIDNQAPITSAGVPAVDINYVTIKFYLDISLLNQADIGIGTGLYTIGGNDYLNMTIESGDEFKHVFDLDTDFISYSVTQPNVIEIGVDPLNKELVDEFIKVNHYIKARHTDGRIRLLKIISIVSREELSPYQQYYTITTMAPGADTVTGLDITGNTLQVYKGIYNFVTNLSGQYLPGFKIRTDSLPNSTAARQAGIMEYLFTDTNIPQTLANGELVDFRYIVDTYEGEIGGSSKYYFGKLAAMHGQAMALVNDPSVKQFEKSVDPSFISSSNKLVSMELISKGGDVDLNPSFLYKFAEEDVNGVPLSSYMNYTFPNLIVREGNKNLSIPPAGYISNLYIRKFKNGTPFLIVAGGKRGAITDPEVVGVEYDLTDEDREFLEPVGHNLIVKRRGFGILLFSNNTAYQRLNSALNNAHVRDSLSTIERDVERILFNYLFDYNDEIVRLRVKTLVENYLDAVVSARGISTYTVQLDTKNNTNDVISANTAIIDIKVDFPRGIHKFINRITITRVGGELSSESSGFIPSF